MTDNLLLEIIVVQLGVLIALFGFIAHGHNKKHESIDADLKNLNSQSSSCAAKFASKDAVRRAHGRIDDHDVKVKDLDTRVIILESCGGKP